MPEDHWVAVQPQFATSTTTHEIKKAQSAYAFFQRDVTESIKAALIQQHGKFDIALFGKAVRDQWNQLNDKSKYEQMAEDDLARYERESQEADRKAMERKEALQKERETLLLDMEGGDQRTTRKGLHKKQKKRESGSDVEFDEESDDFDSDQLESDSERPPKKQRQVSLKQQEHRHKVKQERLQKEHYIARRQEDLRKEKAAQAKRRLEFLLQQSNIFAHFGRVKEDTAKYGIKAQNQKIGERVSRRDADLQEDTEEMDEADEHEATFLTKQPSTLGHGTMRPYQLEGLNWMIRLQENGVNGILADEMGLGKTLQSISILVYMMEYQFVNGPHLIVVPKSTLSNWMNELKRWAPTLTAIKFHGDKDTRQEIVQTQLEPAQRDEKREWNVVVTTYEVCNIEKNVLNKFAWSYLIIDEAHRLKNEASAFSVTIRTFETRYRLLLTGTPLQNSLHELWALLNFLVPDVFESSEQFDEWFNLDIEDNDEKNKLISQLHKILRPFMLRRLKADVEKSLPPKTETILFTGMSAMQKKLYRDILLRDFDSINGNSGSRSAILNIVMQLRKCAGHPYLFPGVEDRTLPPLGEHLVENCGKMAVLDKLLTRLKERGHRVLLFTQMTRVLDIMEDYLVMRQFKYCRIDGNTSYDVREEYIDSFNAPDSEKFIFLLSTRAGGLGINLQTADCVILYDSDWNPQADLQAQDRAHRIGQKRPVQVFRLVTEHTIEEKIVERAQQKLKLDAMVVQQGRLKDKDKLSRDELLAAVRFGADKIFKSKDSSITDADIDYILDQGKQKTQELNDKLKAAEKGDLLDFKFDGSSVQTFEGVDYSRNALAEAKAQAEMLGIFDIGKRERKETTYNETSLYQQQIAAMQGTKKPKKKKEPKLPKGIRLPRMEDWQMYDRKTLKEIETEELEAFKALPEDVQKKAMLMGRGQLETHEGEEDAEEPFEMPALITEERTKEKEKLLSQGFSSWRRPDYNLFLKASAKHGRDAMDLIAGDLNKPEAEVADFARAFWGDMGKTRIPEHEYDRATKYVERGEKRISEVKTLEAATSRFLSLFGDPWKELTFLHTNVKDKLYTAEEDKHLLCWARKYGYGQWAAIKLAIRRHPHFRFNYFMRSLPDEQVGRRCEQLMKAAEKEIEQLERDARERQGLPTEASEGENLPPIELPSFRVIQDEMERAQREKTEKEKMELESKVHEFESQIQELQDRLKQLNSTESKLQDVKPKTNNRPKSVTPPPRKAVTPSDTDSSSKKGAPGPDGEFLEFPNYDGSDEPKEWKKPFTHFCNHTRRSVKDSLDPSERKDKAKVNSILKEKWQALSDDDKLPWRKWSEWDHERHERDMAIFSKVRGRKRKGGNSDTAGTSSSVHVPKKKKVIS